MTTTWASIVRVLIKMRDYLAYYVGSAGGLVIAQVRNEIYARRGNQRGTMSRNVVFGVVFMLTCACLIVSGYFNGKSADQLDDAVALSEANKERADHLKAQQDALDEQSKCQQRVLEHQLDALKARSNFGEQTRDVQVAFSREFLDSLNLLLSTTATDDERNGSLFTLRDAVETELNALVEQSQTGDENPWPSQEEIQSCRTLG